MVKDWSSQDMLLGQSHRDSLPGHYRGGVRSARLPLTCRVFPHSFRATKMKCPFQPLIVSLILTSVCENSGLVDQLEKGAGGSKSADAEWGQLDSKNLSMPHLPADFHKENTVTNDWITEGEEDEDYLDLEKLFSEDDDYIDIIDVVLPTDAEASAGNILQLFQGKSRIQRLNILNAKFAFNLYRALKEQASTSDNIFIAPVGISTAMGMISLGLQGETHEQVHSILHFKDFVNASSKYEIMTIHNLFRKLTHRLFRRNFGYTLRSVNDLYIQKQFPILDDFKTKVKEYYFAEAQAADFSDPVFISKTNNYILKLTKGLIKDALENIDPATEMMILNCIYFKGKKKKIALCFLMQSHSILILVHIQVLVSVYQELYSSSDLSRKSRHKVSSQGQGKS